jgi:hypothetical protein
MSASTIRSTVKLGTAATAGYPAKRMAALAFLQRSMKGFFIMRWNGGGPGGVVSGR